MHVIVIIIIIIIIIISLSTFWTFGRRLKAYLFERR